MDKPTLHLTNWSSRKLHHGRVYSIMANPRAWEHGAGVLVQLAPERADLHAIRAGEMELQEYRLRYLRKVTQIRGPLLPYSPLMDGDTLCCACSRADAKMGHCHRCWLAWLLVLSGWRVIRDGDEISYRESVLSVNEVLGELPWGLPKDGR